MSDPHDKNAERLRRIRKASEEADSKASAPEPAADVILQKIVQEMVAVRRQNDALTAQVKEMRQDHQRQSAEIAGLRSQLRNVDAGLNKQREQIARKPKHPVLSLAEINALIADKLFVLKAQFGTFLLFAAIIYAVFWLLPNDTKQESEQDQPTTVQVPKMKEGGGQ